MLLRDAPLTFGEFMTHEATPLATIFAELLGLLVTREDAVLFGAQAVNAYCDPPRMTEDVDVLTTRAPELAETIRQHLASKFRIAVRVREVGGGLHVHQLREPKNRHLCDVRPVEALPPFRVIEGVRVVEPRVLASMKATSIAARATREKGLSDRLDLARLMRAFPVLREPHSITEIAAERGLDAAAIEAWRELAALDLQPDDDDD